MHKQKKPPFGSFNHVFKIWRSRENLSHSPSSNLQLVDNIKFIHTPPYKDHQFLQNKYVSEGLSIAQIATQIASSKEAVRNGLKRAKIALRQPHKHHKHLTQRSNGIAAKYGKKSNLSERHVIKAIIGMNKNGMTLRQIAQLLTQIGMPTKHNGKRWHPQMVKRVLHRDKIIPTDIQLLTSQGTN